MASLKPSSQPRPLRLSRSISAGCTISAEGESQPTRVPPQRTSWMLMPRVGRTAIVTAPVWITILSTPSCRPPRRVSRLTDHSPSKPRSEALRLKSGTWTLLAVSVSTKLRCARAGAHKKGTSHQDPANIHHLSKFRSPVVADRRRIRAPPHRTACVPNSSRAPRPSKD